MGEPWPTVGWRMSSDRQSNGHKLLLDLQRGTTSDAFLTLQRAFPDFAQMTDEWLFGEIWAGETLTRRDRLIATLATLQALVCVAELRTYMRYASANGMSLEEILELIKHVMNYAGWPSGVNALHAFTDTFRDDD